MSAGPNAFLLPTAFENRSILHRMGPFDDAALMLRYAGGEIRAFDLLYARNKGRLFRYLMRHVGQPSAAADIFQEVWMRVIAARDRYRPSAKFATFLFHIAHHCAIDYHRRVRAAPFDHEREAGDAIDAARAPEEQRPDRIAEYHERVLRFERALSQLPAEQREVFLLHEESGLDLAEIAEVTQVGVETAKSRLRYAVRKLKASLQDREPSMAEAV